MSTDFFRSETAVNLMRAFAGESQARNRYDLAAALCQKQELQMLEFVFRFTARQEQAHAAVFWKHLQAMNGETLAVEGTYPVEGTNSVQELLRSARHNEYEEHGTVYPAFADTAAQEGFPEAAASFRQIAAVERLHGDRFGMLAEQMEQGSLFVSNVKTGWMCLNCGHVQESLEAPRQCPVCSHGQGWFIRLELAPWSCAAGLRQAKK